MAKTLNQIAREYAEQNPNVSIELAFLEGMLYNSKKERESIEERKNKFQLELSKYIPQYGKPMILAFYEYWSETNSNGKKMRFEKEKTWELSKRLKRWSDNNNKYGNRNNFSRQEGRDGESLFQLADVYMQKYQQ
jgi:hypothetical protein